ncbi:MAG: hypothetical protein CSA70_08225 [Rhodobacterales bacterium]|nr:MAG: hypothetical protein CSA70_08225 [Rhodobacterales bacterium]
MHPKSALARGAKEKKAHDGEVGHEFYDKILDCAAMSGSVQIVLVVPGLFAGLMVAFGTGIYVLWASRRHYQAMVIEMARLTRHKREVMGWHLEHPLPSLDLLDRETGKLTGQFGYGWKRGLILRRVLFRGVPRHAGIPNAAREAARGYRRVCLVQFLPIMLLALIWPGFGIPFAIIVTILLLMGPVLTPCRPDISSAAASAPTAPAPTAFKTERDA